MNYIGSKKRLIEFIDKQIATVVSEPVTTFCDLFAGTGVVGSFFKKKGFELISNDLQYYSYILNKSLLCINTEPEFKILIKKLSIPLEKESPAHRVCRYLNNLPGIEGFIYLNYSYGGTEGKSHRRRYFSDENAKKCDTLRETIESWYQTKIINEDEYYYLLACLIHAVDKQANTASLYGAYLKELKKTASKPLLLKPIEIVNSSRNHKVFNLDSNELVKIISADIFYLDPPYNHRQYSTNYHLLETIAKNDKPSIKGKTGLRKQVTNRSKYCLKKEVKETFTQLIQNIKGKYIFLSYNNEGLLSLDEIKEILKTRGTYGVFKKKYHRFKADNDSTRRYKAKKTEEYLHYVRIEND